MIETGIPKLDGYLGGGIPKGKTLLYYTQPGIEGTVFAMQTLFHNLEKGHKGVFVTSTVHPGALRESFKEFGWDIERFAGNFAIVDACSASIGMESNERYVVENPDDIKNIDKAVTKAIEDFSGAPIVFGSLSKIIDTCKEEDEALEYIEKWNKYIMLYDNIGIYNFTAWWYAEETLRKIREGLFNGVIKVGGIAERIVHGQYYGVLKADWIKPEKSTVLFRTTRPGGVKVFIPKVLVTGPFNAGKSTFVQALSTRSVSVDRMGTTVALDYGNVVYKGFSADIFGTPGQERFNPILKLLGGKSIGVFLVVDSTKPEEFGRARDMLEITKTYGLPYVIVANKQDLKGALSPAEIREAMKVGKDVQIIPCVATEKKGVFDAFEALLNMITK
jgi:hypothetical protein